MKINIMLILLLFYSTLIEGPGFVCAQSFFKDPNIPNGETITYSSRVGDEVTTVVENVVVKNDGEKKLYEITSRSEFINKTILLDKDTMAVVSVHTIIRYESAILDSKITVIEKEPLSRKDGIERADVSTLQYFFRGFPFGEVKKLKLEFYGEKNKRKSAINAKHKGTEKVKVNQREIECHKFEFTVDSFWQTFFPKTTMWYSVASPHYLVRYEGPSGPPGAPSRIIELLTYDVPEPFQQ